MKLAPGTFQGLEEREVDLLRGVLRGKKGIGVEIGCCDGYSTRIILESSLLRLTSIDPLVPDSMESSLCGSLDRLRANTADFEGRFKFIQSRSENVIEGWEQAVDFLFIDGNHSEEAAWRDILSWGKFVRLGGLIAVHDSRMGRPGGASFHPGPSAATRELIYDSSLWEIWGEAFSLTVARRK